MKNWFPLLFLLLLYKPSLAQNDTAQHTRAKLEAAIDHNNDVAYDSYLTMPDSARDIAEKALIQSEKIKYPLGIARSYFNIGVIYWSQSYFPIALYYQNAALTNVPPGHPLIFSEIYCNIGRIYADLKDYKNALYNLNKSETLAGNDGNYLGETMSEKAYVYMKLKDYDKAIKTARMSLKLDEAVDEKMGAAIIYSRLGDLYYLQRDYAKSRAYEDTAFSEATKLHMNRLQAAMYIQYATQNNDRGKFEAAISFANKALSIYAGMGIVSGLSNGYKALIKSYEGKNNLKQALMYERKYSKLQDSLNAIDKTKSTELIQNYFELNARLNELALAEKRNQDNKVKIKAQDTIINMLIVSLLIVIAALSITYYYYRHKKILSKKLREHHETLFDQKQLIQIQAENLQVVNDLKDKMLAVVGHDLRTPMANLHNTLSLFEAEDLTAAEVQKLMLDISPIIKGAELTLSNLLEWAGSNIKGRKLEIGKVDIYPLGLEMEQTFHHLLKLKHIEFLNKAQPGELVLADENHIKIILRNLISNAIKFTGDNGVVMLSTIVENNKMTIVIADNGRGMTPVEIEKLFFIDTHFSQYGTSGEHGTGIGLLLCKELVELNGSRLAVSSLPGKGSKFYFELPVVN